MNDIEELFSRDPLSLTPEEVEKITRELVIAFRRERELWEKEKQKAKLTGKKPRLTKKKAAVEKIKSQSAKIDLSALVKK